MSDPIALAEAMSALTTMLDVLEVMVAEIVSRGYTEEQARALVINSVVKPAETGATA